MSEFNCMIKLGGSLFYNTNLYIDLLDKISKNDDNNVFYIGSGPTGEYVKNFLCRLGGNNLNVDRGFLLGSSIHRINALMIESINNKFLLCKSIKECNIAITNKKKPIIDTEGFAGFLDKVNQKTDYQAARICNLLNIKKLVIVTDVSGIYSTDPKKDKNAVFIKKIHAKDLFDYKNSCIDQGVSEILIENKIECIVIGAKEMIGIKDISYDTIKENGTFIDWRS